MLSIANSEAGLRVNHLTTGLALSSACMVKRQISPAKMVTKTLETECAMLVEALDAD